MCYKSIIMEFREEWNQRRVDKLY